MTAIGTLFCVGVALFVDSFNFGNLTPEALRRAVIVDVAVPTVLAGPLLFIIMWKMKQLAQAHRDLQIIAATDGLTSVFNRGAFTMLVDAYLERADEQDRNPLGALLVIDVDHFKVINDTFGHDQGDEALKLVASSIKGAVRQGDLVGRIGGEEFAVFLPSADERQACSIAERIRATVSQVEFGLPDKGKSITVSLGGVTFNNPTSFERLYTAADKLLYAAKAAGRNRVLLQPLFSTVQG